MRTHDQLHQAFQRILAEAIPSTPSGSHKTLIVGQLVVNVQNDEPTLRNCPDAQNGLPCCGRCHQLRS